MAEGEKLMQCDTHVTPMQAVGDGILIGFKWLFGRQDSTATILILIVCAGGYAFYWSAKEIREFSKTEIPKHIEAIQSGYNNLSVKHSAEVSRIVKEGNEDRVRLDEHYRELRKSDQANNEAIRELLRKDSTVKSN